MIPVSLSTLTTDKSVAEVLLSAGVSSASSIPTFNIFLEALSYSVTMRKVVVETECGEETQFYVEQDVSSVTIDGEEWVKIYLEK